ncbi:hypothetical protein B2G88_03270 [Natronolimnobius baerhuensis]|uniref:Uncharacterized protein n=1 Tax=Natronolimnobius baerhuensis TaxID=253108 RepID=A0A202ECA4_9EURY|nr:hypothetical protein B2G88_03270 [Natronolimnobius baerhuensis]
MNVFISGKATQCRSNSTRAATCSIDHKAGGGVTADAAVECALSAYEVATAGDLILVDRPLFVRCDGSF